MSISRDEWLSALHEAQAPPDPHALTTTELADLLKVSTATAKRLVARLLAQERAIRTVKVVDRIDGHPRRVPAYRLVKGRKK